MYTLSQTVDIEEYEINKCVCVCVILLLLQLSLTKEHLIILLQTIIKHSSFFTQIQSIN